MGMNPRALGVTVTLEIMIRILHTSTYIGILVFDYDPQGSVIRTGILLPPTRILEGLCAVFEK